MKGIDTMNAKEARENAMKILYPPIEEEIQEILEKLRCIQKRVELFTMDFFLSNR